MLDDGWHITPVEVTRGVKPGDPIFPVYLSVCMDQFTRASPQKYCTASSTQTIWDRAFADDLAFVAESVVCLALNRTCDNFPQVALFVDVIKRRASLLRAPYSTSATSRYKHSAEKTPGLTSELIFGTRDDARSTHYFTPLLGCTQIITTTLRSKAMALLKHFYNMVVWWTTVSERIRVDRIVKDTGRQCLTMFTLPPENEV